jgi:hypothetical protein
MTAAWLRYMRRASSWPGQRGAWCFANDTRFVAWLAQCARSIASTGCVPCRPRAVQQKVLSPLHVLAQVRWSARFEKTGDRAVEFEIAYLVEQAENSWRVLGYVSERDQEDEMRSLGLL